MRNTLARSSPRPRHPWLYALPGARLPANVYCLGRPYQLIHTFKHDFFAGTGLYRGDDGHLAVLKMNRTEPAFGVPLRCIGRFLAAREIRLYRLTADLPGVPALTGPVGDTGLMHDFVPGHPLGRRDAVSDTFFDELMDLLRALHRRNIAYVDLNKRQNILKGDDGRPYLIDFQISLWLPNRGWRRAAPVRWLLRRFQQADRYHTLKHKRRLRPDQLTPDEEAVVERLSIWIRLHRSVARPLTMLRRRVLKGLQAEDEAEVPGSSAK